MDLVLQQVSPAPDGPVVKEPQVTGDNGAPNGGDIFSVLLLLSLMGKNGGQDPVPIAFQGEDGGMRPANPGEPPCPSGAQRSMKIPPPLSPPSCLPPKWVEEFGRNAIAALPQGEGRYERLPIIPPPLSGGGEGEGEQGVLAPLPLVPSHEGRGNKERGFSDEKLEEIMSKSGVLPAPAADGLVAKEPRVTADNGKDIFEDAGMRPGNPAETSMSHRLTEEHENVIPAQAGIQNAGRGLDSHFRGNDGHSGDAKGDVTVGLLTDQGKMSIPGLHGLENQASPAFGDSGVVPVFLKESDYQNNPGANSDSQGEYPWMGSGNRVSVTMDPVSPSADSRLQSFQMPVDQENILQQLSARMTHMRETGTHSARIRLKPDELGELSLDISVTNNSVKAFIRVENYHVKEIIEANLNRLETELKNQGLSIEQFTVETGGGGLREGYVPSHDRRDSAVRGGPGRTTMDHSADQGHLMISDSVGRGIVNLFV